MPNIELYNADCIESMKDYPDNHFDLAICDVNYGIKQDGRNNHTRGKLAKSHDYRNNSRYDEKSPDSLYFDLVVQKTKHQIFWGANHYLDNLPFNISSPCWIVWDKKNGMTDFADCELAWTNFSTAVRIFRFQWQGMLQGYSGNKDKNEKRIHPNQKPVALYKWLLKNYAKEGDKILDTHLGSGSIAIACHDMGFDLTGYEIDEDYFKAMTRRFEDHKRQLQINYQ